jgi:hypothetical protein
MNRRGFVRASGLVAALYPTRFDLTRAQNHNALPDRTRPPHQIDDPGGVQGVEQAVYRSFEASEAGFMDIMTGGLVIAAVIGIEFDAAENASRAVDLMAESFTELYAENVEGTASETVEASVGRLGDERVGMATTFRLDDDDFIEEFVLGTIVVRKDRYLQVLIGASTMGPLSQLAQISEDLDSRWPSDDVWDIVPELADMPVGMVLDEEDEYSLENLDQGEDPVDDETSEPDEPEPSEIDGGSLTFSVELRVSGLYLDANNEAGTCSGAGFYDIVDAGSEFRVFDRASHELLYSTILSKGTLQQSSCFWLVSVLGLPPRPDYDFFVGQKRMGMARYEDIQPGDTIRFDKDK